jgi:hypothetical protein
VHSPGFIEKKDGELRMVIDHRTLNKLTIKNRYSLPRIDDQLAGSHLFSLSNLAQGYHQIQILEEDARVKMDISGTVLPTINVHKYFVIATNYPTKWAELQPMVLKY